MVRFSGLPEADIQLALMLKLESVTLKWVLTILYLPDAPSTSQAVESNLQPTQEHPFLNLLLHWIFLRNLCLRLLLSLRLLLHFLLLLKPFMAMSLMVPMMMVLVTSLNVLSGG